jgi:PAS domain S-box-containing protein
MQPMATTTARRRSARPTKKASFAGERFEILARATSDAVWDWDIPSDSLWWNENFHSLFGYPPEATLPTLDSWTNYIHPADKDRVMEEVRASLESSAEQWSSEYRYRRGDGTYADVFDRGCIVRDAAGRPVRVIGMMQDISARKTSEDTLRRFRAALDRSGDLIALVDRETMRYVDVNDAMCRALGYTREELICMAPEQLLPLSRQELCDAYDRLIATPTRRRTATRTTSARTAPCCPSRPSATPCTPTADG